MSARRSAAPWSGHALAFLVAALAASRAASAGIAPLLFEARTFDVVVLNTGEELRGTLLSDPTAETIRLRLLGRAGERAFPRNIVKRIQPRLTLEQAHDELAAQTLPEDYERWHALALGCLARGSGLLERAEADLRKAIRARSAHVPSHVLLAKVLLARRKLPEARAAAETAAALPGAGQEAYIVLGQTMAALGEDPRDAFLKALALKPSAEAHVGIARAELARRRYAAAESALSAAEALAPASAEVRTARGDALLARANLDAAAAAYSSALSPPGGGFELDGARLGLAAVKYLQGRFDEAEKVLLDADLSNPNVSYMQGLLRLAKGGAALGEARSLLGAAAAGGLARAYLGLGTHLYHDLGGDVASALAEFRRSTAADPSDPLAHALVGWCEHRLGRNEDAAKSYARAAELAPTWAEAHAAAAAAAYLAGSHAEAARRSRAGLDACPGDARLLAVLGLAQLAGGDPDAAAESLGRSLEAAFARPGQAPTPDTYLGLGFLAHMRKNSDAALRYFAAALSATADGPSGASAYALDAMHKLYGERDEKATILSFDAPALPEPFRAREGFGVKVSVELGRLLFAGTQEKQEGGRTSVDAAVDGVALRSFSADLETPAGSATAGIRLESQQGGVELALAGGGAPVYRTKDGREAAWSAWSALEEAAPAPGVRREAGTYCRLSIVYVENRKDCAKLELRASRALPGPGEEAAMRTVELKKAFWSERALTAGVFVAAPLGSQVAVRADNVTLVERSAGAAAR